MKILVTGPPGCGKTTLIEKVREEISNNITICGFISREVRKDGKRTGFKLIEVNGNWEGTLADTISGMGPRVGKYFVNLKDIENAMELIESDCQLIIIDEIGPMELKSDRFVKRIRELFQSDNNILATIHYKSRDPLILELKERNDVLIFELSPENRERIREELMGKIWSVIYKNFL